MIAYFLNSRTGGHGAVNVRLDSQTLERFVGGAFVRRHVRIGGHDMLVIAEYGDVRSGSPTACSADSVPLYGNLLVIAFDGAYVERDITTQETDGVRANVKSIDGMPCIEYGRPYEVRGRQG